MTSDEDRDVVEVIGVFEMWDGSRAREVVATYGDDTHREIEVGINERYVPKYTEIE